MRIPKFWANASEEVQKPDGQWLHLKCWGWSTENLQEAQTKAQEALDRMATRVRQGAELPSHYGYGTRALREEIIREVSTPEALLSAIITRNSYGSLILNTNRVLFIDVDVPAAPEPARRLFGLLKSAKSDPSDGVLSKIQTGLEQTEAAFRVYRTAGGFRVMATDPLYEPGSSETERLMEKIGADPSFIKLCRAQQSFRARLTPKPWRCGKPKPPVDFPRENSREEEVFRQWLADYDAGCSGWATCHHVRDIGPASVHDQAQPLLDLHDRFTKSTSSLPLA